MSSYLFLEPFTDFMVLIGLLICREMAHFSSYVQCTPYNGPATYIKIEQTPSVDEDCEMWLKAVKKQRGRRPFLNYDLFLRARIIPE